MPEKISVASLLEAVTKAEKLLTVVGRFEMGVRKRTNAITPMCALLLVSYTDERTAQKMTKEASRKHGTFPQCQDKSFDAHEIKFRARLNELLGPDGKVSNTDDALTKLRSRLENLPKEKH